MDSFICHTAPCPTKRPSLEPTVPDVSILMNNVPTSNAYQCWKNNFQHKEVSKPNSSILKKQVRFNSPVNNAYSKNQQSKLPNRDETNDIVMSENNVTPPMNKILRNKHFEQIYMANIPNRHLDLSLINDPKMNYRSQKVSNTEENYAQGDQSIKKHDSQNEESLPTTYKEFLKMQQQNENRNSERAVDVNPVTDIFNYNSPRADVNCAQNKNYNVDGTKRNQFHESINQNSIEDNIIDKNVVEHNRNYQNYGVSQSVGNIFSNDFNGMNKRLSDAENYEPSNNPTSKTVEEKAVSTSFHKSDEPNVKDLLKIIQQQNEQLLILQKQVATLLESNNYQKQIEAPTKTNNARGIARQGQHSAGSTPRKAPLPTFSIDMMTSFEVSFRPQQNLFHKRQREFVSNEPKIQEITENESNLLDFSRGIEPKIPDGSIVFQEPINVQESCPSPEPSINIDMKEYESSDDDNDDMAGSQIGATFYKNLMNQVNKIIQTAHSQKNPNERFVGTDELREKTFCAVKDATIKHLRKIGMNFPTIEEVDNSNCSSMRDDPCMEQISFAVKQLLLKYLPDDQLAKLKSENKQGFPAKHKKDEKIVLNSRAPEFSFATLQFMKKYNLIAGEEREADPRMAPMNNNNATAPKPRRRLDNNPKILDISALKQQPKLL